MELLGPETRGTTFDSLYLGGGTPSWTPASDLGRLLDGLRRPFSISPSAEVTLEANPEDVTPESARFWAASGITRVSVGIQSFEDRELSAVGRRHDSAAARRALDTVLGAGLSVSGDLILGLPGQSAASFRASLSRLIASGAAHVSVYLLETEKSKTIEEDRRAHPSRYLSDDEQAEAWLAMGETLGHAGFGHYEISNWALPGREARHNLKYWKRIPTLGLGVSAHELWNGRRRAVVSSLPRYIGDLAAGIRPLAADHLLGAREQAGERIVLGLRRSEGVLTREIHDRVEDSPDATLPQDYGAWKEGRLLDESAGRARLTERGFLLSNEILCRFV